MLPALAAAPVGGSAAAPAGVPHLVVRTASGEVLVDAPLPPGGSWTLSWTHSVAQVTIRDVFAWRDGTMLLTDHYTPYLDIAGLGYTPGRGELVQEADGGYHIRGIDQPIYGNVFHHIIGTRRAPSVLIVGDQRFELSATHPGTHARIEVTTP